MAGRLDAKVLVVTGGTMGMGRAFAERAAVEGARVVIGARDEGRGREVVDGIRGAGGTAVFVPADVTVEEDLERLVDVAVTKFGRLDGAFNNAGGGNALGTIRETKSDFWHHVIAFNLTSVYYSLKYEIPAIVASGGGAIVNNASTSGVKGDPMTAAYTAAKHGVVGLTRSAALDVASSGVRINALVTGLIDTPMWREVSQDPAIAGHFLGMQPTGRAGSEQDVAAFTTFLLSDEATYITGASLAIDGGFTAK